MLAFSPPLEARARKLARCGKCEGCTRLECGECGSCSDKPRFGGPGVKKQACEARKCLRMSRQREEADPMPKKRAKGVAGGEWETPSLLQDMDILGEIDLTADLEGGYPAEGGRPLDAGAPQSAERSQATSKGGAAEKKDKKAGPRLRRCGKCLPCNRGDCGLCHNCADKPKFGGSGVKKQACVARRCLSMLRRDSTPSPPLGCDETGASPSGVLDFWDPASWNQSLSDQLGEGAVVGADDVTGTSEHLADMLGADDSRRLLQGKLAEPSCRDELSLQMKWSESCLAAIEQSMHGTSIGPVGEEEEEGTGLCEEELLSVLPLHDQGSGSSDVDVKFSAQLDPFSLGFTSLAALPSIDEPCDGTPPDKTCGAEAPPDSPGSALTEEVGVGPTDDPWKLFESRNLSPSEADVSDPTGGIVEPLDEEDYCGWLAEGI
ncbi:hypothetical protein AB1Y20_016562 [Prymnesium parvum]|uniref:CXXC-type domain-containing protein n=1 Tax=Prymnesium parvum TaxID=97485 RepID=A0AB34ICT3_PRYPA|mmetsp:Transcript_37455/g.93149  ORF Transcript_37455/g.93149 Transcript_37455/m.93149 type:complete len:434 (+) Transcript_37455:206-1507(+)